MDNVIKSELQYDNATNTMTHVATQPTEDIILSRNAELRKNPDSIHDLGAQSGDSWGRQVASIPEIMFYAAIRAGFDLNSRDSKVAGLEMARFLRTPEGKTCLVQAPTQKYF